MDSPPPVISPMVRIAIFVSDLNRSATFYRDVIGLKDIFFSGDLSDGNAHELLAVPSGSQTRALILKAPGPAYGMLGLFEITHPKPDVTARDLGTSNVGETCLVFCCSQLDPIVEQLEREGNAVTCHPTQFRIGGVHKQREMTFRDPDGVMINLIEWDPDADHRPELVRNSDSA